MPSIEGASPATRTTRTRAPSAGAGAGAPKRPRPSPTPAQGGGGAAGPTSDAAGGAAEADDDEQSRLEQARGRALPHAFAARALRVTPPARPHPPRRLWRCARSRSSSASWHCRRPSCRCPSTGRRVWTDDACVCWSSIPRLFLASMAYQRIEWHQGTVPRSSPRFTPPGTRRRGTTSRAVASRGRQESGHASYVMEATPSLIAQQLPCPSHE